MNREQSDEEYSVMGTGETEVNAPLACGSALVLELVVPIVPGVVTPDPGQQRRLGPLSGTKPHQSSLETPTRLPPGLGSPPPRAGTQPVTDRFVETPSMPTPGYGSPLPKAGMQPVTERFVETLSMSTPGHGSPPPRAGIQPATVRFAETPTVPTPGHGSSPPKAGTQPMNERAGKQQVTNRFAEILTLPTPGLDRPSRRTETQLGTDVRDSPV